MTICEYTQLSVWFATSVRKVKLLIVGKLWILERSTSFGKLLFLHSLFDYLWITDISAAFQITTHPFLITYILTHILSHYYLTVIDIIRIDLLTTIRFTITLISSPNMGNVFQSCCTVSEYYYVDDWDPKDKKSPKKTRTSSRAKSPHTTPPQSQHQPQQQQQQQKQNQQSQRQPQQPKQQNPSRSMNKVHPQSQVSWT